MEPELLDARHLRLIVAVLVLPDAGQWCSIRLRMACWKEEHGA